MGQSLLLIYHHTGVIKEKNINFATQETEIYI